jgi:serine/threonine protein phosphatase PrpC
MAEHFYGITDVGRIRDNNEDTFIAEKVLKGAFTAACVIDGVGGYEGGEVAASIARDTVLEHLNRGGGDVIKIMKEALLLANERIYNERSSNPQRESMACVLTMALVDASSNQFYYAHVGDTRLYLFRDNSLVKLTKDQSFVGFLEDSGRITEKEAMSHPKRNEINKALGFDPQMALQADYIETGSSPFLPGDLLLLCSDGLTDLVDSQYITAILSGDGSLEEKSKALVAAANNAGGKDNITVVLVENAKRRTRHKATRPAAVPGAVKKNDEPNREEERPPARVAPAAQPVRSTNYKTIIIALVVLSVLLLAALLWNIWRKPTADELIMPMERDRHPQEQRLVDALNGSPTRNFSLSTAAVGSVVPISDTILIERDSLHINGNGVILAGDSLYRGPVFVVAPTNRYLVLENMTLQDFNTAIVASRNVLHLRNVQFRNCPVPVQYQFLLPNNRYISGRTRDSLFFISDSLPRK